jgi:hypothetical protein
MIEKISCYDRAGPMSIVEKLNEVTDAINELERRVDSLMKRLPSADDPDDKWGNCADCGDPLERGYIINLCKPCQRQHLDKERAV